MTRLINFGLGEIVDRLTILGLKITHYPESAVFTTERDQLIAMIKPRTADTIDEWAQLARVNNALWQAEDRMRAHRDGFHQLSLNDRLDVADLGLACQSLNDERAELIRTINESQGDPHVEKPR